MRFVVQGIFTCAVVVAAASSAHMQVRQTAGPRDFTVPDQGVVLPIVALTPNPIVEVRVNGHGPFRFMLDTGGQGHARADAALVTTLNLPVVGQVRGGDGGGNTIAMDVVRFDTLALGGAVFRNIEAASRDYNRNATAGRIDGVLGLQLFANHLLTIDYLKQQIHITPGALPAPDGNRVLAYDGARGTVSLPLKVGPEVIQADIDTGSMGAIMLPSAMAARLPLAAPPAVSGQARTVSNTVTVLSAPLTGEVVLGSWRIPSPTLEFSDLFNAHANIGSQVLRAFAVTIDQSNRRVRFDREGDGPVVLQTPRRIGMMGTPSAAGFVIDTVLPGGAGARAGLQPGDVVTQIGGRPFGEIPADQVGAALTAHARVALTVQRGDRTLTLTVVYEPA